jgi:molybdate transport system substrate-binding protein
MIRGAWALAGAVLVAVTGCSRATESPLKVSAAVSLTDALDRIAGAWRARGEQPIVTNLAASNILSRQIEEGAPVDVFISADEPQLERLVSAGLIDPSDRVDLLSNQLVIVVPAGRTLQGRLPGGLAGADVTRLAIGDPEAVPAGVYAKAWLVREGLWDAVADRVVPSVSVRAALAAVEAGNAEAGIVYRTDALGRTAVDVAYQVPVEEAPRIVYPAAVVKASDRLGQARRFTAFLQSEEAAAIFRASGFVPLARTEPDDQ